MAKQHDESGTGPGDGTDVFPANGVETGSEAPAASDPAAAAEVVTDPAAAAAPRHHRTLFGPVHRLHRSRSRMLRLTTAAMLATVAAGGLSVVQMRKQVTLEVDGDRIDLVTLRSDVGTALSEAGYPVGDRDAVEPATSDRLSDGSTVVLRRARQIMVDVDEAPAPIWTTARTVGELLEQRGGVPAGSHVEPALDAPLPEAGAPVTVVTPRTVHLADGGAAPTDITAPGVTVGQFLARAGLVLGPQDLVEPAADTRVGPETTVTVTRITTLDEVDRQEIVAGQRLVEDPEAEEGSRTVVDPGVPGARELAYRVTRVNGQETERTEVSRRDVTAPRESVVRVGTKPARPAAPSVGDGSVWDSIAQCEATGNWAIDTGNGFSGGLQFTDSTWQAYGGGQYASRASGASREQQIAIAQKVQAAQGWGAWPACTSKLGLR